MINGRLTNREMAATDPTFRRACEEIGVFPSSRRYRQFKHHRTIAGRKVIDNAEEKGIQIQAK